MSLAPYIVVGAIVIVISVVGLFSDGISKAVRWVMIGLGVIIGFGIIAAIVVGGFGFLGGPLGEAISNAK